MVNFIYRLLTIKETAKEFIFVYSFLLHQVCCYGNPSSVERFYLCNKLEYIFNKVLGN